MSTATKNGKAATRSNISQAQRIARLETQVGMLTGRVEELITVVRKMVAAQTVQQASPQVLESLRQRIETQLSENGGLGPLQTPQPGELKVVPPQS